MRKYMTNGLLPFIMAALLFSSCHENFDERCNREAKEFTLKQCPQKIPKSQTMTLDSMAYQMTDKQGIPVVLPEGKWERMFSNASKKAVDRKFVYFYTLSGQYDTPKLYEVARQNFKKELVKAVAGSVDLKPYKDRGFGFEYVYYSKKSGKEVMRFVLTKADYIH